MCYRAISVSSFYPYELGVEEQAPFSHKMVTAYTNDGSVGYIPTDKALALGSEDPLNAEHECMEATAWPGFFYGVNVRGGWLPYKFGIEAQMRGTLSELWAP